MPSGSGAPGRCGSRGRAWDRSSRPRGGGGPWNAPTRHCPECAPAHAGPCWCARRAGAAAGGGGGGSGAGVGLVPPPPPAGRVEAIVTVEPATRRSRDEQHHISAVEPEKIGRGGVPEILADQDADPAEARIEGAHLVAPGEEAPFIEEAVGGQIDFAVDVDDLSLGEVGRREVETAPRIGLDKTEEDVDLAAGREEAAKGRIVR